MLFINALLVDNILCYLGKYSKEFWKSSACTNHINVKPCCRVYLSKLNNTFEIIIHWYEIDNTPQPSLMVLKWILMWRVYVLGSSCNIRCMYVIFYPCSAFELVLKMHLGYFCGTVQIPIFVIQQAGTSEMDLSASSNSDFVNPCVRRF